MAWPASADNVGEKRVSIGFINADWFPFHFKKDNQVEGFAIDVVSAVFKQMRQKAALKGVPFSTALDSLNTGQLDAYVGLARNPARAEEFRFGNDPVFIDETVLIGRTEEPFVFNGDVSNLIGNRIGIIKGAIHGPAFDNMNGIIRVPRDIGNTPAALLFEGLLSEEVRFLAINARAGALHYIRLLGMQDQMKIYEEPIAIKSYYLVFSKQRPDMEEIASKFDQVHRLFRSTSEYKALLEKYNLSHKLFSR